MNLNRLKGMPVSKVEELLCAADCGVWAERRRGFSNAPFQWEWYRLIPTARRLAVCAPREHAKTEIFTVNQTAWRSIYQPGIWTYIFGATDALAQAFKERIDAAVEETSPDLVRFAQQKSKKLSVYSNGSRVQCAGAGSATRGAHPDIVIGDDVLEESTCLTSYQREKTKRWWKGAIGGMAHPGTNRVINGVRRQFAPTRVFLVGTPFHQQDLLLSMASNPLYVYRRYSAEPPPRADGDPYWIESK